MEVHIQDSFFKSLKKLIRHESWWYKTWSIFRYDIWRFLTNLRRFRKELWNFYPWDSSYNLQIFSRSLEITVDNLENRGMEVPESRMKKVVKMKRAIELIKIHTEDDYIQLVEKEFGYKLDTSDSMNFVPIEDNPELCELVDNSSEEIQEKNSKIFTRVRELEEEHWIELWTIIRGQGVPDDKADFNKWYDGSDLRGWWN
jgi:hypothetical protein